MELTTTIVLRFYIFKGFKPISMNEVVKHVSKPLQILELVLDCGLLLIVILDGVVAQGVKLAQYHNMAFMRCEVFQNIFFKHIGLCSY